jgi:Thioredoxin
MKQIALTIIGLMLIAFSGLAQRMNATVFDEKSNEEIMIDQCNRKGLLKHKGYGHYFKFHHKDYKPDVEITKKIIEKIDGKEFKIKIVLGTWCMDSKIWVPRFFKLMDEAGIKDERIEMIALNSNKYTFITDVSKMDIEKVPTFIVYNSEGKELGRITEKPEKELEKDFLKIIKKL